MATRAGSTAQRLARERQPHSMIGTCVLQIRSTGPRAIAGMLRPVWLVSVATLPFACSVYGPNLLGSEGQAGTSGGPPDQVNATAGDTPDDGSISGGGGSHAAGTTGEGPSTGGRAPGMGGVSNHGGTAALDRAGAGGASSAGKGGTSAGGTSAGGTSTGGTSAGGTSAGGTSAGGTSAGGTSAGGMTAIPGIVAAYPCESANGSVLVDASGNGKNASLANGSGGSSAGFSFSSGVVR